LREKLEKLLPEVRLIEDAELAEKVLRVWQRAIEESDLTIDDLEEMPFTLLFAGHGVNFIEHVRAVTKTAVETGRVFREIYGDRAPLDMDHLIAGALLHDVGKILEVEKAGNTWRKSRPGLYVRHPFSGVALAHAEGVPYEVVHLIAVHSKEGDGARVSTEAFILNHADFANFEPFRLMFG
jgi:putative nucleotidyltransferase with HDIG domain